MTARIILSALLAASAAAAQVGAPRLGCFVDEDRKLRPVLGVAGVFLVGQAEAEDVVAAACTADVTVIKKENTLEVRGRDFTQEWPAPEGTALIALSARGTAALVYYPATTEWVRIDRDSAVFLSAPEGEVVAIADPGRPTVVVRREGRLWIDGPVSGPLPEDAAAPALPARGAVLFIRGGELVMLGADGSERRWGMPDGVAAIERLGRDWVRLRLAGGGHLALSLAQGELYRLPEAKP